MPGKKPPRPVCFALPHVGQTALNTDTICAVCSYMNILGSIHTQGSVSYQLQITSVQSVHVAVNEQGMHQICMNRLLQDGNKLCLKCVYTFMLQEQNNMKIPFRSILSPPAELKLNIHLPFMSESLWLSECLSLFTSHSTPFCAMQVEFLSAGSCSLWFYKGLVKAGSSFNDPWLGDVCALMWFPGAVNISIVH